MKIKYLIGLLCVLLVSSCTGRSLLITETSTSEPPVSIEDPISVGFSPSATITPSMTPTKTITQTPTKMVPSPTITLTPQPLEAFSSTDLRLGVSPIQYIKDPCSYLENRWGEGKSEAGTIVVPIMFHSIVKPGRVITDSKNISTAYFEFFMKKAKEMDFSTITMDQLAGFLEENEKIPVRSMILIQDDRSPGVTELFMPYLEENDWTLTLAWPTTDKTGDALWLRMETLAETGRLDVQSHGHDHDVYFQDYTPLEEVEEEIFKPIDVIQSHFGTTPVSIVWPGGNFTEPAIQLARKAGLKLGFTVYSRGPLMFNWIPLGEPESAMDDPLMVLPRFWSTAADVALDQAVTISEAAKQDANAAKAEELRYYSLYCQSAEGE